MNFISKFTRELANGSYSLHSRARVAIAMCVAALVLPLSAYGDQLQQGSSGPFMQNVTDPTHGLRYLAVDDDLSLLRLTLNSDKSLSKTVTALDTSASQISGSQGLTLPIDVGTNASSLSTSNGV